MLSEIGQYVTGLLTYVLTYLLQNTLKEMSTDVVTLTAAKMLWV